MSGTKVSGHWHRRRIHLLLLAAGVGAVCTTGAQAQQWTAISLHPAGATDSVAEDVDGVMQVGSANVSDSAVLWSSSASSAVWLNPSFARGSLGRAVLGGQQAGNVYVRGQGQARAGLWSGTPQSWVDLHPTHVEYVIGTVAYALDGSAVGGAYYSDSGLMFDPGRACMWTDGTAQSWVDLQPPAFLTSNILDIQGNQQVGATYDEFLGKAGMWSGTAESFVDLNPLGAFASVATCTDGTHQYGAVGFLEPTPALFAARWSGTAESWEDMGAPEGWFGGIGAEHGGWKAGSVEPASGEMKRATVWTDGPGSYIDLHGALAPEYTSSEALGIWRHMESGTTYAVGWVTNSTADRNEAMMWVTGPGVNLITSAEAPPDCSAGPGAEMVYTARVINAGEQASGPVTLTVELPPANVATFAGSTPPPSAVSPTQVTIDLGSIAPVGGFADVTVTLTAVEAGETAAPVFSASAAGEVHAENNAAIASSQITPTPPAGGPNLATAIFSTDPSLDNSLVPGLGGARFSLLNNNPAASPSGNWWAFSAGTDLPQEQRFLIVRVPTGGAPAVAVQYGEPTSGGVLDTIYPAIEVNDSGLVAFSGADSSPSLDRFIATTDGTSLTEVARQGQPFPANPEVTCGTVIGHSANVFANGGTGFLASTFPTDDPAYLSHSGSTVIAQPFITVPTGADFPLSELDNAFNTLGCQFDASGQHHIYSGRLATGNEADDRVVVADGAVLLQEGVTTLPGMEAPVGDGPLGLSMSPGGVWMVRGANTDGEGWVIRGQGQMITRVFRTGEPIHPGAAEVWQGDLATAPFFAHVADSADNFVIGGMTSNANSFANSVLVYNDEAVIAQENDPIDLDGNGVFDDGVYIRSIEPDSVALIQGAVLFRVTLRDENAALCHTNDESRGMAIVRVDVPGGCASDWDNSGSVNSNDISAFLTDWLASLGGGTLDADFNGDMMVNSNDISAFLTQWLADIGGC